MKKFVLLALLVGLVASSATAATRYYYINFGQVAVANGGAVQCLAIAKNNFVRPGPGANGFRCYAGGDYRATWGVEITHERVKLLRYTGMNTYRVVLTKNQLP